MKQSPPNGSSDHDNPKSKKSKFRQESTASKPSDKLRHEEEPQQSAKDGASGKKAAKESRSVEKSKLRADNTGKKLDSAKEKLAKQKPQKPPGALKSVSQAAGLALYTKVHGKIHEVERDNVGVEAAHRAELIGERACRAQSRFIKQRIRTQPARRVNKLEKQSIKANADLRFREMAQENPELKRGAIKRYSQKRRLRKQYEKKAKEAAVKTAKKASEEAVTTTGKIVHATVRAVGNFITRHPILTLILIACFLVVVILQSCVGSALTIGNTMTGSASLSTYPSEDAEMLAAEAAYATMESALQYQLDNYELLYPGYHEYHYELDEIEHDPYVLISMLSALYEGAWTLGEVQGTLAMLFDLQYTLDVTVTREVRYRTETRYEFDPFTGEIYTISYEVPYNYYICTVTLDNFNLSHLPVYIMSGDSLSRYAIYMATHGNRPDLFPSHLYPRASTLQEYTRYDIPPEYMGDPAFAAIIKEAEKYLGFPYVWGGSRPETSFDCSGFVSWVINQTGWNVGRLGARGLYGICTPVSTANAKPGDLISNNP